MTVWRRAMFRPQVVSQPEDDEARPWPTRCLTSKKKSAKLQARRRDAQQLGEDRDRHRKGRCTTLQEHRDILQKCGNNFEAVNMGVMVPCKDIFPERPKKWARTSLACRPNHPFAGRDAVCGRRDGAVTNTARVRFLLIGGATCSRVLAIGGQDCPQPVGQWCTCPMPARRGCVLELLSPERQAAYIADLHADYERAPATCQQEGHPMVSLAEARANKHQADFATYTPEKPKFIGPPGVPEP